MFDSLMTSFCSYSVIIDIYNQSPKVIVVRHDPSPIKLKFYLYMYVCMYASISHQDRLADIKCFHSYIH